jgi:hypothetical protein
MDHGKTRLETIHQLLAGFANVLSTSNHIVYDETIKLLYHFEAKLFTEINSLVYDKIKSLEPNSDIASEQMKDILNAFCDLDEIQDDHNPRLSIPGLWGETPKSKLASLTEKMRLKREEELEVEPKNDAELAKVREELRKIRDSYMDRPLEEKPEEIEIRLPKHWNTYGVDDYLN